MNRAGHLAVGISIGIIFLLLMNKFFSWFDVLNYKAWFIYIPILFLYPLLADIDHKMSTITWMFIGLGVIGMGTAFVLNNKMLMGIAALLIGLTYIAAEFFPHRGPTHTIWFAALTCIPIYLMIGYQEAVLAMLVYYSHLAADGLWFKISF